ncbi:MAG: RidA family protein [Thermoguttaceae bacterium]|jgi:enamine deaminase RidA (YjgF/YER057c/UK114 family)
MTADTRLAEKLAELGLSMPPAPAAKGVYRPLSVAGGLVYASGHLSAGPDGQLVTGRVGQGLDVAAGYAAARLAALGILASLQKEFGTLDRIRRLVKLFGVVACTPEFTQHPAVLNGASELLAHVLGPEAGIGARSAIGAASLPLGAAVEIEAVFELQPVDTAQSR